jgi:hypothetical protein
MNELEWFTDKLREDLKAHITDKKTSAAEISEIISRRLDESPLAQMRRKTRVSSFHELDDKTQAKIIALREVFKTHYYGISVGRDFRTQPWPSDLISPEIDHRWVYDTKWHANDEELAELKEECRDPDEFCIDFEEYDDGISTLPSAYLQITDPGDPKDRYLLDIEVALLHPITTVTVPLSADD